MDEGVDRVTILSIGIALFAIFAIFGALWITKDYTKAMDCFCQNEGYEEMTDYNGLLSGNLDIECDGVVFKNLRPVYTYDKWGKQDKLICYERDWYEE